MIRKPVFALLFVLALFLASCAPVAAPAPTAVPTPEPIQLTDGLGRKVALPAPARRIVSLAPSNTEILFAVGAGEQVVGRDDFSDYPAAAQSIPSIGGTLEKLNSEKIVALKPDLVLAAGITPPEQVKALEDVNLTVYVLPNPTQLDGMYENLRTVSKLTGHSAQTEEMIASLQKRVQAVQAKMAGVPEKPLVFYELDGSTPSAPWTSGPGTFIDTLIAMAGGRNAGSGLKDQWMQISLEELVSQNPHIILLGDATLGGMTPEMVKHRGGWEQISAVHNNRIYPLDDNLVSRPGPRMVDGLETLAKIIHPELFQ